MSSSKNLEFEKTAFLSKSNSAFIEEMYVKFINNDPNLPDSWKEYFKEIGDEADIVINCSFTEMNIGLGTLHHTSNELLYQKTVCFMTILKLIIVKNVIIVFNNVQYVLVDRRQRQFHN